MKKVIFVFLISCFSLTIISCSEDKEESTTDTRAPVIAELTAVTTPTIDTTPNYYFSSTKTGTITYGGSCSSSATYAISGKNRITLVSLNDGTYSDCTITVTDKTGNVSNTLTITSFVIDTTVLDTTAPIASVTPASIKNSDNATVRSSETGRAYLVNTAISVSNLASITDSADNVSNYVTISLANSDTNLPATGLVDGTYRVYAKDDAGNLSSPSSDNVTIVSGLVDIDGNEYSTVVIGTQHWMAENLKVTKYRNGDNITNITNNSLWNSNTSGAYGYYNNSTANRDIYGLLYNGYAVDDIGNQICPQGWHVPSSIEFDTLKSYLVQSGDSNFVLKLREEGTDHWSTDINASNSSGFTALGSGYLSTAGASYQLKVYAYWWTCCHSSTYLRYYGISTNTANYTITTLTKNYGFSVRCLED